MNKTITLLTLLFPILFFAQEKSVQVNYISETIKLDAILDEPAWNKTNGARNFWQYFPTDSLQSENQSEIKMLYDDKNLYVGIKVNTIGNNYIVPSLRRDFRAGGSDNITLLFDTFNDGSNAFLFGVNPAGVRREALVSGGGTSLSGFTTSWDTKWLGETKTYDGYYISEWSIPLSAFKFNPGERKWRFNSYQFDTQSNERNTWINIPRSQFIFNLAFMGNMEFEKPLNEIKSPISLIPYISAGVGKDFEFNEDISSFKAGGDAKFILGNSINVDLTINPDFSQVEADNLVTNLTRFEINLPERRQFFIENSDLFADFGISESANPFFSRRIGIAKDSSGINRPNDIIGGVRLSGKLNNNFRIGILNMQTQKDKDFQIASSNNSVIALQHKLFSRSNISAIFVNRQNTGTEDITTLNGAYNRVLGLDYNLASKDNTWNGKFYTHTSFSATTNDSDNFSSGAMLTYNNQKWRIRGSGFYIGDHFVSDLGFIPRKGIFRIDPKVEYLIFPQKGLVNLHNLSLTPNFTWKPELDFKLTDYNIRTNWNIGFKNTSELSLEMFNKYTYLFRNFDPSRSGKTPLPANTDYRYTSGGLSFKSNDRSVFSYGFKLNYGEFYNGNIFTPQLNLNLRLQPRYTFGIEARYDRISLPKPYASNEIWLLGSSVDITFNKSLFWATLIQYSNQEDNLGINSRLQWRFAPLSDLYLIYNDNYYTNDALTPRFRTINLKITYWLYL